MMQSMKERIKNAENAARTIMDDVNCMSGNDEANAIVDTILNSHRTLQQSFFSLVFLKFVEKVANTNECFFDDRNEEMKIVCDNIFEMLKRTRHADEINGEKIVYRLPFI